MKFSLLFCNKPNFLLLFVAGCLSQLFVSAAEEGERCFGIKRKFTWTVDYERPGLTGFSIKYEAEVECTCPEEGEGKDTSTVNISDNSYGFEVENSENTEWKENPFAEGFLKEPIIGDGSIQWGSALFESATGDDNEVSVSFKVEFICKIVSNRIVPVVNQVTLSGEDSVFGTLEKKPDDSTLRRPGQSEPYEFAGSTDRDRVALTVTHEVEFVGRNPCGKGEPHFTSWTGTRFDFQGECDLVLASSPTFADGKGLDLHARTSLLPSTNNQFSVITEAAVRIGVHVLSIARAAYWLDGERLSYGEENSVLSLDSIQVDYVTSVSTKANRSVPIKTFLIHLTKDEKIKIRVAPSYIDVAVSSSPTEDDDPELSVFHDTIGLLGRYHDGALLDRNGVSMMTKMKDEELGKSYYQVTNENEYGQMWQVREWEHMIFPRARAPQHPKSKCILPEVSISTSRQLRALVNNEQTVHEAEKACAHVSHKVDRENCVFDILATGDLHMADSYSDDDEF